jgi:hypothetical protein
VKADPLPLEISVSAGHPDVRRCLPGSPIKVQMEISAAEPWKAIVHRIQPRNGTNDDVVPALCGVIDHINQGRSLLHIVVAKGIDGTLPLADFTGSATIGQAVAVRMTRYHSRKGARILTLSASPTNLSPAANVLKRFNEDVEVRNGLGFTSGGIFIPPDVVAASNVTDGDRVEGHAVINFDKKRSTWGWKAIRAARRE